MADKNISYLQLDIGNGLTTQNGLVKLYIDPDCGLELSSDGLYCSLDAMYNDTVVTEKTGIAFDSSNYYCFNTNAGTMDQGQYGLSAYDGGIGVSIPLTVLPEIKLSERESDVWRFRLQTVYSEQSADYGKILEESNGKYSLNSDNYIYMNTHSRIAYIDKACTIEVGTVTLYNASNSQLTSNLTNENLADVADNVNGASLEVNYQGLNKTNRGFYFVSFKNGGYGPFLQPFYLVDADYDNLDYKMISYANPYNKMAVILFVDKSVNFDALRAGNAINIGDQQSIANQLQYGTVEFAHFVAYADEKLTIPIGTFYKTTSASYNVGDNAFNLYDDPDIFVPESSAPNAPYHNLGAIHLKCYDTTSTVETTSSTTTANTITTTDTSSTDSSSSSSTTTTTTTTTSREVDKTGSFGFEVDRSALVDNWTVVLVDQDKPNDRIHLYPDQQISNRLSSLLIGTQSTIPLDLIIDKFKYEKELIKCNRNVVQSCYSFCMYRMSRKIGTSDTVRLVKQSALKTCDDLITELNFPLRAKYLNLLKNFGGSSYHTDMPSSSSKTSRTDDEMYTEDSKPPLFVDRSDSGFTKTPPMLKVGNLIAFTDHAFVTVLRYSTNLLKGHVTGSDLLYSDERIWDDTNDVLIDENASTNNPFKPFTVDSDGKYHISIKGKVVGDQFLLPTIDPYYWPYEDGQRHAYNTMVDSEDGLTSTPIGHVYAMFVVEEIEYFDPTEISRIVDKSIRHSNSSISDNNIGLSDFGYRDTGFNQVIPMIKRMKIRCIWSDQSYNNEMLDQQGWRVGEAQEGQAIVYGQEFNEYNSDLDAPVLMKISDYYQYIKDNLDEYDHENTYKESYSPTVWVGRVELASDVNNKIDITFSQKCNTYANNNF